MKGLRVKVEVGSSERYSCGGEFEKADMEPRDCLTKDETFGGSRE